MIMCLLSSKANPSSNNNDLLTTRTDALPGGTSFQVSTQDLNVAALAVDGDTPLTCAETQAASKPWW